MRHGRGGGPVSLDGVGELFPRALSGKITLHFGAQHGIVIIGVIVIIGDHIAAVRVLFYDGADVIGAGHVIVTEGGYQRAGIGNQLFALVGEDNPVQEALGGGALLSI